MPDSGVDAERLARRSESHRAQSLGFLSFRLALLFERRLEQRLATYGVTVGQLRVMFVLWETGSATQSEIARQLGVSQPTIGNTLSRMARDGLVTMSPDPAHGRRLLASLTERADSLAPALLEEAQRINDVATGGLDADDAGRAARVLRELGDALERPADDSDAGSGRG